MQNKTRVGILTYHQAVNYGAVLQCYALQEVLKRLNYETKVINYNPAFRGGFLNILAYKGLFRALISLVCIVIQMPGVKKESVFRNFRKKYLLCTKRSVKGVVPQNFDIYLLGSDQLWRTNFGNVYIDTVYFGEFTKPPGSKICGYAISGDVKSVKSINSDKLLQYANYFDSLSFREESLGSLVNKITRAEYRVDIDPTLLADKSIYDKLINSSWANEKYVLLYNLRGDHQLLQKKTEKLAKELGCKIINFSEKTYTPNEFVSLFKYASYVVTSSFHGTAFSLIFERPFYSVMLNDGHDARYVDLLNSIGAEDAIIDINTELTPRSLNYELINNNLNRLRMNSLKYLSEL